MRKLLVLLAVLVLLVVGADIAGRLVAQNRAAAEISRQRGPATIGRTTVAIRGFSFLAQAIPGHYQHVSLHAPEVGFGPVTGIDTTVELYDVEFPLSDALEGDTANLVAGRATVRGVLPAVALTAAIAQPGASVSTGTGGSIEVTAPVSIAGRSISVTAELLPSFSAGVLRLTAMNVRAAGFALPDVDRIATKLSLALPLDKLPFTVDGATVTSSGTDLVLSATAYDVRLAGIS